MAVTMTVVKGVELGMDVTIIEEALNQWFSAGSLSVIKSLNGGRSGAAVLLVDYAPHEEATAYSVPTSREGAAPETHIEPGQYILKIDKKNSYAEPDERERHEAVQAQFADFAREHVPPLKCWASVDSDSKIALLYGVAGQNFTGSVTADTVQANALERHCGDLSYQLLHHLRRPTPQGATYCCTAGGILENWLGYRLRASSSPQAAALHAFVDQETSREAIYPVSGEFLINPMWFCTSPGVRDDEQHTFLTGLVHGDLHARNVLLERRNPSSSQFWLIDFALSQEGALGYDHAYLEFALLLNELPGANAERLLNFLRELDNAEDGSQPGESVLPEIPTQDVGVFFCVRALRRAASQWQQEHLPNRHDAFCAQMWLARVAVALNWANKGGLTGDQRQVAIAYGGWAARAYLQRFDEAEWRRLLAVADARWRNSQPQSASLTGASSTSDSALDSISASEPSCWSDFWQRVHAFDGGRNIYILVTGPLQKCGSLSPLATLPLSAIIDLDASSDTTGFSSQVLEDMKKIRSVSQFGFRSQPVQYERGTAWIMAAGWPSHSEPSPPELRSWRRSLSPCIQALFANIKHQIDLKPVKVLVLASPPSAPTTESAVLQQKLQDILQIVDQTFEDQAEILWLGHQAPADASLVGGTFTMSVPEFVAGIRASYGVAVDEASPTVPSGEGDVPPSRAAIPLETLRNIEEEVEVLHSRVLFDSLNTSSQRDDFWRGNPPTWADLHANADIARDVHPQLVQDLESLLRGNRNETLELHHEPGAGGTTAALRAAWTLHTTYPVAIVRRYSKSYTFDRVDRLFRIAQRPVLLIVDASLVPASAREELYQGFTQRNARVVILYVMRVMRANPQRSPNLTAPMSLEEARKFRTLYAAQTRDPNRLRQLNQITDPGNTRWKPYRLPFFYGLVTYDRDFASIDTYVESHLKKTGFQARAVLQYLSLITRFSQARMSEQLFAGLMGANSQQKLDLEGLLGASARLILRQEGHLKLSHPLLAEEVLRQLLGVGNDDWKNGLATLAKNFIRDVIHLLGADATETDALFFALFLSRSEWSSRDERDADNESHQEGARDGTAPVAKQATSSPGSAERRGRNFSELIETIPSSYEQHYVLEELTQVCPAEAHYWNHLGRHHIYRMRLQYEDAEGYLAKAVELAPEERFHHHSLGMVYRLWAESEIDKVFQSETDVTPEAVLDSAEELSEKAFDSFAIAREKMEEDAYGYISHVQLVLLITRRLLQAAGVQHLSQLRNPSARVNQWVEEHLSEAEQLLARVQHLRGAAPPTRFENRCVFNLKDVYGDFNALIRQWESLLNTKAEQPDFRRALASAYYARRGRDWSSVGTEELRKIVSLMDSNLSADSSNEHDIRMWFQSYRRLREFDIYRAFGRLETWAQHNVVDAHYYLYILHFLQWRDGVEPNQEKIRLHLEQCKRLSVGRRGYSYEWLGLEPNWCPLVHHRDLGERKDKTFYPNAHLLGRFDGVIKDISGPQAGTIRIGEHLDCFFVPGQEFWRFEDVEQPVNFYLGFSYEGPRAWEQKRGFLEEESKFVSEKRRGASLDEFHAPPPERKVQPQSVDIPLKRRVKEFVTREVKTWEKAGRGNLLLKDISAKLAENFASKDHEPVHKKLGFKSLSAMLTSFDEILIDGEHPNQFLRSSSRR